MAFKSGEVSGPILTAVNMRLSGCSIKEIAEALGKSPECISAWLKRPEVREKYAQLNDEYASDFRDALKGRSRRAYDKALGVMESQLDSENEWVKQNAARDILTRFQQAVVGDEANEVIVRFEGMPTIGEPSASDEVDE